MKSMKLRLMPTANQRKILRQWMGTVRFLYNKANQAVREKRAKSEFKKLRQTILTDESLLRDNEWLNQIPNAVKQTAIKQLSEAYKTNFAKKTKTSFQVQFKSKKLAKTEVAQFDKRGVSFSPRQKLTEANVSLLPTYLKTTMIVVDSKKYIKQLVQMKRPPCEVKIQYHYRSGNYYLLVPVKHLPPLSTNANVHGVVSIDPGVRTFATCYSPTAGVGKLPIDGDAGMKRRYHRIDRMKSALATIKSSKTEHRSPKARRKTLARMTKKVHRLWQEIDDCKHHMHYSIIKFLLSNFEQVVIPDFDPHSMTDKRTSVLASATKRAMFNWGHGLFRQRLKTKASLLGRPEAVVIVTEEYTSKTCGNCGNIKHNLGSTKTYHCEGCGMRADRDVNGARNILLKHLTESGNLEGCGRVDVEGPQEEMINISRC